MRKKVTKKKREKREFDWPYFDHKNNDFGVNGFVLESIVQWGLSFYVTKYWKVHKVVSRNKRSWYLKRFFFSRVICWAIQLRVTLPD
jgi:uncharacterized membrane-anchored protein